MVRKHPVSAERDLSSSLHMPGKTCTPPATLRRSRASPSYLQKRLKLGYIEAQIRHATHVKQDALANGYKSKEHLLADGAARDDTGALHI